MKSWWKMLDHGTAGCFSSKVYVRCNHRKQVWKGDFKGYIIHPPAPRHDQLYLHHCKAATLARGSTQWYKVDHKPALSLLTQDHKLLYCRLCKDCSIQSGQNHDNILHVGPIHFVSNTSVLKCLSQIFSKLCLRERHKLRGVSTGSRSLQELKPAFKSWGSWATFHHFLFCFNSIAISHISFCHTDNAKSWHQQLSNLCGKTCLQNSAVISCQQADTQLARV